MKYDFIMTTNSSNNLQLYITEVLANNYKEYLTITSINVTEILAETKI